MKRSRQGDWVRSYTRVQRAITATLRLIASSRRVASASARCAHRRPISSSRQLTYASRLLSTASARLSVAATRFEETRACLARQAELEPDAMLFLRDVATSIARLTLYLGGTADEVFALHDDVLDGLASGELVAEPSALPRRHIPLVPRPVPVREFLRARLPRVVDRISAVLQRRRRTRLPTALRVPRRTSQGRAPPLLSACLL